MNEANRPAFLVGHPNWQRNQTRLLAHKAKTAGVLVSLLILACLALTGCTFPGSSKSSAGHICADKVLQSVVTNGAVEGLWKCLTPEFQAKLQSYATSGLINSADDAAFTNPSQGKPPGIMVTHFVGKANGVDLYTIIVQGPQGVVTLVMAIWVNLADKVDNFGIGSPIF
jgi:hypothetical protein